MAKKLFFAIFIVVAAQSAYAQLDSEDLADRDKRAKLVSHCNNDEVVVFTCKIKSKTASVCAALNEKHKIAELKYRFGEPGKIEIEISKKPHLTNKDTGFANIYFASAWAYFLKITNGKYDYYFYSTSVRGADDPESGVSTRDEPSGVAVRKEGAIIYNRLCSTPAFDHNLNKEFLGGSVMQLDHEGQIDKYEFDPFELAYPSKP